MNVSVSPTASFPSRNIMYMHRTVCPLFVRFMGNNAMFPDTNSFLGYTEDDLYQWIHHLYAARGDTIVDSGTVVNSQTSTHMTCAQYCVRGLTDVDYADHQTSDVDGIQVMSVHRESEERRVTPIEVFTNNNNQFNSWCCYHNETLQLDLTIRENQRTFRQKMGLADIDSSYYEADDVMSFMEMYHQLIVEFQKHIPYGLSPMNGNSMMLGTLYAMLCSRPDIVNSDGVYIGSLSDSELGKKYELMLKSEASNMNESVLVELCSITTTTGQNAEQAIAILRHLSAQGMNDMYLSGIPSRTVSLFEGLERFLRIIEIILSHGESNDSFCNDGFISQYLDGSHWTAATSSSLMEQEVYRHYLANPCNLRLLSLLNQLQTKYKTSLCKVDLYKLININYGDVYKKCKALDPREWNLLVVLPSICFIVFQSYDQIEQNFWNENLHSTIVSLMQIYCGTIEAKTIQVEQFKESVNVMLNDELVGILSISYLWEAAVIFDSQDLLISSMTKADDSLTFLNSVESITNQQQVQVIGYLGLIADHLANWLSKWIRNSGSSNGRSRGPAELFKILLRANLSHDIIVAMNKGSLFPRLRSQQIQTNTQYELAYLLNYIWRKPGFEEATAMAYWKAVKKSAGWTSGGRRCILTRCLTKDVLKPRNTFVIVLIYYVAMIKDLVEHHGQPALDAELEEAYDCNNPRQSFHINDIEQLGITRRFPSLSFLLSSCCEVSLSHDDTNELRAIDMKSKLESINFHQHSLIEEESDGSIKGNGHHDATNNSGDKKDLIDSDDSVSEDGSRGIKPVHSPKDQPKSEQTELPTREEVSQHLLSEATVHDFINDEIDRTLLPSSESEKDLHRLIQNASPTSTEQDEAISKEIFYHASLYQANIDSNGRGSCDIRPPKCSETDESNHSSNGLSQYNDNLISMDFIGCIPINSMDTDPESSTRDMNDISTDVRTVLQEFQESPEEEEISPMDIDPESSTRNMDDISNETRTVLQESQESSEEADISPMDIDPESSTLNMDDISNETRTVLQEYQESSEEADISPRCRTLLGTGNGENDEESSPYISLQRVWTTQNLENGIHFSNSAGNGDGENDHESSSHYMNATSCDMSVEITVTHNELHLISSVVSFIQGGIHDLEFDPPSIPPSWLASAQQAFERRREREEAEKFQNAEALLSFARQAQAEELLQKLLCKLSDHEEGIVKRALDGVGELAVFQGTNIVKITSMQTLKPEKWLNDEIINYFFREVLARWEEMLCTKQQSGSKRSLFLSSFFVQCLHDEKNNNLDLRGKYNYDHVKRWTKGRDIFSAEYIFIPVNIGNQHWILMVILMEKKEIRYYDSLPVSNEAAYNMFRMKWLLKYLEDEFENNNTQTLDQFNKFKWTLVDCSMNTPKQTNGYDCGVFICLVGYCIINDYPLVFSQSHIDLFRKKIILSIMDKEYVLSSTTTNRACVG